uniref:Uncharacterized protein n=1 Tax=Pycnococcus provasolii TaxID=41880 RepID=A0A7S2F6F5_9CHLO|mmetsp:Transcript_2630/g.5914  ORF Transcript_2630/g.5914 Transcript_2630/m.5914 type:complete len:393 (+) Transcript_2630:173-1351(+)
MTTTTSFTILLAPLLLLLLTGTDGAHAGESWVFNNGVTVNGTTGDLVAQGDLSGVHLESLIDDAYKQNVTFADKKKMLLNILGLKVVDFAYNNEFQDEFVGSHDEHYFDGKPPHWYKAAYYRGILAESLAYHLPQALTPHHVLPLNEDFVPGDFQGQCCQEFDADSPNSNKLENLTNKRWYAKLDVIVTELVGAVQALFSMAFDPVSLAKLAAPGPYSGGGPISLGMFIGSVLELISHKGFGDYSKSAATSGSGVKFNFKSSPSPEHMPDPNDAPVFHSMPLDVQHEAQNAAASVIRAVDDVNAHTMTKESEMNARFDQFAQTLANDLEFVTARANAVKVVAKGENGHLVALERTNARQRKNIDELLDLSNRLTVEQDKAIQDIEAALSRIP